MKRILASLVLLLLVSTPGTAQESRPAQADLIQSALSAAPSYVAEGATVMDFEGNTLRAGTNDWVCMPDDPNVPNNSPMCLDEPWREVIDAWMNQRDPEFSRMGISYMLQGDLPVSNVDPFATAPAPGNQWIQEGTPHIMIVLPDHSQLEGLSRDPSNGGPWVMWTGTPYAHIMIPTVPRTH